MTTPNIADVARRAKVSPATVSRHLMGHKVRAAEAIEAAISELGYRPSPIARSLRSGRTQTIAVVIPDISNPFFGAAIKGAEDIARAQNYTLAVFSTDDMADVERTTLTRIRGRVDGLIIAPAVHTTLDATELERLGIPVVLLDRELDEQAGFDTVLVDSAGGAAAAAAHLLSLGHQRFGLITGPLPTTPAQQRLNGFLKALEDAGLDPQETEVLDGRFSEAGGHQAMLRLLSSAVPPTAVFVANNEMTIGAVRAARDLGIRIPEDVSMVGFDDHPVASLLTPALTVVDRPTHEQGALAMRLMLRRLGGDRQDSSRQIVLDTRLVVRGSTSSPEITSA